MKTRGSNVLVCRLVRIVIACWGVLGVLALLSQAIIRLTPIALEPIFANALSNQHIALYTAWVLFNLYAEGYKGFQRGFSPRIVARAFHLGRHPSFPAWLLAPLYCMGYFGATKRRMIVSWTITLAVVALVVVVRYVAQPYRGIIDGGVVLGLLWGAVAIAVFFLRALRGYEQPAPIDLPLA